MSDSLLTMLKVAGLSAFWAVWYAVIFYSKAWQSGKEKWRWSKFWTTVLIAAFAGFGSSLLNQTPSEFLAMVKDSVLGTFAMALFENAGKIAGRAMRGVPPEEPKPPKEPPTGADTPPPKDGDAENGEDPESIVADALKPLKPELGG